MSSRGIPRYGVTVERQRLMPRGPSGVRQREPCAVAFPWKAVLLVAVLAGPSIAQEKADFIGNWVHVDPGTNNITRIVIAGDARDALSVHAFGACRPTDCDWGQVSWDFTGPPFVVVYEFGWLTTTLTMCLPAPDFLFVQSDNVFHDGTFRDYVSDSFFRREGSPPDEAVTIDDFVGSWVNLDPVAKETEGLDTVRVMNALIERVGDELTVALWGVCQPDDCDTGWGTHLVRVESGSFRIGESTIRLLGGQFLSMTGGLRADSFLRRTSAPEVCRIGDEPRPLSFLRGDCDGDGVVEGHATDALFLLNFNFLAGLHPPCLMACDANGDGRIAGQVTDAVYLLTFNFLGGSPPVRPFPACGDVTLETDDALGCGTGPRSACQ